MDDEHPNPPPPPNHLESGREGPKRLKIMRSDLHNPAIDDRVHRMQEATRPQLIQQIGTESAGGHSRSLGVIGAMVLAGLIGGLLGWGLSELVSQTWRAEEAFASLTERDLIRCMEASDIQACIYQPWYGASPVLGDILWLGAFGLVLGAVITGWDAWSARSWPKFTRLFSRAAPLLIGAAVVGGGLAGELYRSLAESATDVSDLHFPRGVSWALFGAFLGVAIGMSSRSVQRGINGAVGGAVGGFIGGFVFDYIDLADQTNGIPNRIVGLAITGTAIAVSISLVELARREHWIEIVSGGMAGKQFILYHDESTIGLAPDCDITLIKDSGIAAHHATLTRRGDTLHVRPLSDLPVSVNGISASEQQLGDGDLLQLGSTVVRYRSKQAPMPTGMPVPQRTKPDGMPPGAPTLPPTSPPPPPSP